MSKSFSAREKTLLVILCVILVLGLYYLMVFMPTSETMTAAQAKIDELAGNITIEEEKAAEIQKMRQELEQVAGTQEAKVVTPVFDNFQNLLDELNVALATAEDYKLNFGTTKIEEGIAKRELQLVYYTRNYYAAKKIIDALYSGPYRCDITSFKLAPTEKDVADIAGAPVAATLSITYYELAK